MNALVAIPSGWELAIVFLVILLLFGAKRLPEMARGSGRALRIFKEETTGLLDDDATVEDQMFPEKRSVTARNAETEKDDPIVRAQRDGTVN